MHQAGDAGLLAGAGDGFGAADHGAAHRLEIGAAAAMGQVDHGAGGADGAGDGGGIADVAAMQRHAGIGEDGRKVDQAARHDRHAVAGGQQLAHDMGADEAGAAEDRHVPGFGVGVGGLRGGFRQSEVGDAFAGLHQVGAERAVQRQGAAGVQSGVEGGDTVAHRDEEGIAARPQLGHGQRIAGQAAHRSAGDGPRHGQAGERGVHRLQPAGAALEVEAVGQDVGHRHAVVADHRRPARTGSPGRRRSELGGQAGAGQGQVQGAR